MTLHGLLVALFVIHLLSSPLLDYAEAMEEDVPVDLSSEPVSILSDLTELSSLNLNDLYEKLYDLDDDQLDDLLESTEIDEDCKENIQFVLNSKLSYHTFLDKVVENMQIYLARYPIEEKNLSDWLTTHALPCFERAFTTAPDPSNYSEAEKKMLAFVKGKIKSENVSALFSHTLPHLMTDLKSVALTLPSTTTGLKSKQIVGTNLFNPLFKWIKSQFAQGNTLLIFASPQEVIEDIQFKLSEIDLPTPYGKPEQALMRFKKVATPATKYGMLIWMTFMIVQLLYSVKNLESNMHTMNHMLQNLMQQFYANHTG
jgi:hypothetical protein